MGDNFDSSDINILIVGETGVGKSTFVNSFVNYIKFNTFDEAVESEDIISVIPSNFTITDHNLKETQIKFGEDPNESSKPGASSTIQTRIYKVPYNNRRSVVLIDTAGVGDTSGVKMDEENLQNLLATIAEFKHMHAILILLHPNNSRVSVLFTYCIKQLLSSLEKSAAQNIVFVFTNSRGTFYRPGDTLTPLRAVLNEIENKPPNVKVPFSGTNTFCVDNEAFRFLIAKNKGIKFLKEDINAFAESWNRSAKITFKMLEYIQGLKPHNIQGTLSVNAARTLIIRLSGPLAQISQNIVDNINRFKKQQELRANTSLSLKELRKKLAVKRIGLKIKRIPMPRTVCGHEKCVKYSDVNGASTVMYPQICHANCKQKGIDKEIFGKPRLMHCSAFKTNLMPGRTCRHCKHSYLNHMHIYYEAEPFEYDGKDEKVSEKITTEEEEQREIQKLMAEIKSNIIAYKSEQMVIQRVMANFAHFLKHNAITPFNDAYKNYITYYIEMENSNGSDNGKIAYYQGLLAEYEEAVKMLEVELETANKMAPRITNSVVSSADVEKLKNELISLRMSGPTIKEALDAQRKARYNNQIDFVMVDTGKRYNTKKY